ncbi:NAD(P)/FAD-dependent oxidoreductase [Actinomadura craniellae]|uniref:NAD(P)/FAD-dependent oxidoreductase n=1 Tax=Actinomadura craniellae TaxID=2231787 RepID=A0A365H2G9_9ACTN|nr:NAD(P)/FAD-dependent oxidoreductase [Actinomadura craniellae]RAY13291.1 NAD(P)/FAD-dependent oxidoreductase [Actinomadura craniellae]
MPDHDVVVLGGGTSGELIASELARAGRSVALVEERLVGGGRPHFADLPAKSLLHSARRGESWELAVARRRALTGNLDDAAAATRLTAEGVTLLRGRGRITGPGTVEVDGVEHGCTDLVVCTGSEPVLPEVEGLATVPVWTSDNALSVPDLPRRLVVLGGGPYGCELAQAYAAFGSHVTLVEPEERLLGAEAPFIGDALAGALRRRGAELRLGTGLDRVDPLDPGVRLWLSDGVVLDADRILVAGERRPRITGLGLETLGLVVDPALGLPVDETGRLVPEEEPDGPDTGGVWAAGDVTGLPPASHTAAYQARVVASNVLGKRYPADHRAVPRVVRTTPAAYAVGLSPARARELDVDLLVAGHDLARTVRTALEDDGPGGRVELYADRDRGVLVGAAAVGPYAEEWMGEIALAIRAEIPLGVLTDMVHAFPTYGESLEPPLRELARRL